MIDECTKGKQGNLLLFEAGVKTKALGDIKYIPRIHINGVSNAHTIAMFTLLDGLVNFKDF